MKTVLFVPGFREDLKSRDYKGVIKAIEGNGYRVKFVPIHWKRTLVDDWVGELKSVYDKHNPKQTILAGFSCGSMTALIAAAETNPAELWLFSLSPYFSEDMPKMKQAWLNNIGHRRADAFRDLNFNQLAKTITCPTLLVVGELEAKKYPLLGRRAQTANKTITNSRLVTVDDCGHDVADKKYVKAIVDATS